jgi:glycosyltransferase involved in cell wall biosynthesis
MARAALFRSDAFLGPLLIVVGAVMRFFRTTPQTVRSVLQVSFISHKQFMVTRALRKHGVKASFLALNTTGNDILDFGYDYFVPDGIALGAALKRLYYLVFLYPRYDVIHFHFNALLTPFSELELGYLKRMGKVVVFHFRGCDVRHRSTNLRKNPVLNCCQECDYPIGSCDTARQFHRIAMAEKYGDGLLATTPDLRDFVAGAEHLPFIAPLASDFEAIAPASKPAGIFRVVTSSNHPGVDGVPHIRAAVACLKSEGRNLELVEIYKRPFREALSMYKSADVFAGKLRMGYYNNANIETMLMGVPNMAYIRDEFLGTIPDSPIINTRPETIYENIKYWMDRPGELEEIGRRGPEFVRRHHDPDQHALRLIEFYNRLLEQKRRSVAATKQHKL